MAAIDFAGMFDAYSALNEKEWKYDRQLSLGASEVFTCLRKCFFKKFGYEADDDYVPDWGAARRGDVIENNVAVPSVMAVIPEGASLIYAGEEQETLKKGRLSATPDGLVIDVASDVLSQLGVEDIESDCFVTEFKSFDPRASIKGAKPVHVGQVQVQMGLIHELTPYRPEYALIIYFNASFISDIRIFWVKRDPKMYDAAKLRSNKVYATKDPKDLMPEGKINGDCKLCEFTEECAVVQGDTSPKVRTAVDSETHERLAALAVEQKKWDAVKKEAEQEKKIAEEQIKAILREKQTKGVGDDSFSISLSWSKGKSSLDLLSMADDGIDLSKYQKTGSGFDTLRVKLKGVVDTD